MNNQIKPNPKKPRAGDFYRWLVKQKDRDDSIGDISRDAQLDNEFPIETSSIEELRDHLIDCGACNNAIKALENAHKEFKNNNSVRCR